MADSFDNKISQLDMVARQEQLKREAEEEKRKRYSVNQFVQIDKKAISNFRKLITSNVSAANVLMALVERMNRQNAIVISYESIEKLTGYKKSSVTKAIAALKKGNWIEVIKIGTANAYRINSRAFWQSYGDKKYTSFSAQIIAFEEEQPKTTIKEDLKVFPFVEVNETVLLTGDEGDPPVNEEMDLI